MYQICIKYKVHFLFAVHEISAAYKVKKTYIFMEAPQWLK